MIFIKLTDFHQNFLEFLYSLLNKTMDQLSDGLKRKVIKEQNKKGNKPQRFSSENKY